MPEGPEIRVIAEEMSDRFEGKYCFNAYINTNSRYYNNELFHSDYIFGENGLFTVRRYCTRIKSFGKKIIFEFRNKCFICSCLMDGRWWFESENWDIRIEFENGMLYFEDHSDRYLFSILTIDSENYDKVLKSVGPDYFYVELEEFEIQVKRRNLDIQDFLMDQSIFSGIGNYLKSDILFASKIHPKTKTRLLSDEEIITLFNNIKEIMVESYLCGGSSFFSYRSPSGKQGTYSHLIYGRKESWVKTTKDRNGRITYYSENF